MFNHVLNRLLMFGGALEGLENHIFVDAVRPEAYNGPRQGIVGPRAIFDPLNNGVATCIRYKKCTTVVTKMDSNLP